MGVFDLFKKTHCLSLKQGCHAVPKDGVSVHFMDASIFQKSDLLPSLLDERCKELSLSYLQTNYNRLYQRMYIDPSDAP